MRQCYVLKRVECYFHCMLLGSNLSCVEALLFCSHTHTNKKQVLFRDQFTRATWNTLYLIQNRKTTRGNGTRGIGEEGRWTSPRDPHSLLNLPSIFKIVRREKKTPQACSFYLPLPPASPPYPFTIAPSRPSPSPPSLSRRLLSFASPTPQLPPLPLPRSLLSALSPLSPLCSLSSLSFLSRWGGWRGTKGAAWRGGGG